MIIRRFFNSTFYRYFKRLTVITVGGGVVVFLARDKFSFLRPFTSLSQDSVKDYGLTNEDPIKKRYSSYGASSKEYQFYQFASLEYNGQIYMTPTDFLECVTENEPRYRRKRRELNKKELDDMLNKTPIFNHIKSSKMFRNLDVNGIITYSEYLFLLCVLTKPRSGFRIAFTMFDKDNNLKVEKREFEVVRDVVQTTRMERFAAQKKKNEQKLTYLFSSQMDNTSDMNVDEIEDTTLNRIFFGRKGNYTLDYRQFSEFMENLQEEVLEIEFDEFAKGTSTITETEFGRLLLRYTKINAYEYDTRLQRVRDRLLNEHEHDIPLKDFVLFFKTLMHVNELKLALSMFMLAGRQISEAEFQMATRAVVGYTLNPYLVHTVFSLFDKDNNGLLGQSDFFEVLNERMTRGSLSPRRRGTSRWVGYRYCVNETISH